MKYQLDEELRFLEKMKMPANIKLLPAVNFAMNIFQCKPDENVDVKRYKIPGYQGAELPVLVIEPRQTKQKLPGLVYFHGGGFVLKASGAHYQLAKEYAAKLPCRVTCADYRLAPKFPFPVPAEDCFCAYQWVQEHTGKLQLISDRIMVAGDSAGGNLAAAVTLMARDRGIRMPDGVMLIYPVVDRRMDTASMKKYTDTPVWDARLSGMMWDAYLGRQKPERAEYASPLEAPSLQGFPPTYMEVAEFDVLHDEGVMFYDRLRNSEVEAELYEIKGTCHGFEVAVKSSIMRKCMDRRLVWMNSLFR